MAPGTGFHWKSCVDPESMSPLAGLVIEAALPPEDAAMYIEALE
jgi:hypothetical protein